ncbi:hypothetical protein J4411_01770 [Candidatus Pacearchaeota archaeon]|nr:hypothetical protein [Candidatus Pacearchaeota archaeon]
MAAKNGSVFLGFLALIILLLFFNFALAHLDAGEDVHKDGYIIDFGYSPSQISDGKPSNIVFNLVNETTEERINLTFIWVRISSEKEVVFAGEFYPEKGSTPFTFTFPHGGKYAIDIKFYEAENLLTENSFYLNIKNFKFSVNYLYLIIVLLVVSTLYLMLGRNKKK